MKGKTKLVIGSIVAAMLGVACISAATIANASSNTSAETNREQAIVTKVADNLGLPYDQVLAAFDNAQQELRIEALQQRLAQAVTDGTITQDESDQITAWISAAPAAVEKLGQGLCGILMRPSVNFSATGMPNPSAPPDMGNSSRSMRPSGNFSGRGPASQGNLPGGDKLSPEEYIQQAIDSGIITQAQADEITAWINAMPDAMTKVGPPQTNGHMGPPDANFCPAPF